jgi:hypothetical protein
VRLKDVGLKEEGREGDIIAVEVDFDKNKPLLNQTSANSHARTLTDNPS